MTKPTTPGTDWIRERSALLLGALLMLPVLALSAQDSPVVVTNEPAVEPQTAKEETRPGRSFEDFQLITERNIFDPNRSPRSRDRTPEPERPPEPKIDIVALTGTLSYAKGTFAFFDSNSSDFRKTAKVGDVIAGYTLKGIEQSQVALEHENKLLELKVGQQLRRQDEGAWEVTVGERLNGQSGPSPSSTRRSPSSRPSLSVNRGGGEDNSVPPDEMDNDDAPNDDERADPDSDESGEGPSEILKRLMEQRKKEQAQ